MQPSSGFTNQIKVQSPNIFCLSSRRCCASSDKLAVGQQSDGLRQWARQSRRSNHSHPHRSGQWIAQSFDSFALTIPCAQFQRMLFFNGGAISRIGHHHGVLTQVFGGFAGIAEDFFSDAPACDGKKPSGGVVHVFIVRHGQNFCIRQQFNGFVFQLLASWGSLRAGECTGKFMTRSGK